MENKLIYLELLDSYRGEIDIFEVVLTFIKYVSFRWGVWMYVYVCGKEGSVKSFGLIGCKD